MAPKLSPPIVGDDTSWRRIERRPWGRPHRLCGSSGPSPWKGGAGARPRQSGEEKPVRGKRTYNMASPCSGISTRSSQAPSGAK